MHITNENNDVHGRQFKVGTRERVRVRGFIKVRLQGWFLVPRWVRFGFQAKKLGFSVFWSSGAKLAKLNRIEFPKSSRDLHKLFLEKRKIGITNCDLQKEKKPLLNIDHIQASAGTGVPVPRRN